MNDRSELLERFLDELIQDPDTPAPLQGELDSETVAWARRMVAAEQSQMPNSAEEAAAQARVWARVLASRPAAKRSAFSGGWLRIGLAAAVSVIAIAIGLYGWASQPPAVSAQAIIEKARVTANSPAAGGVSSFVLAETRRTIPTNSRTSAYAGLKPGEQLQSETQRWYQAPNRWRAEYQQKTIGPDGKETNAYRNLQVGDGTDLWQYDPANNSVIVNALDPSMNGKEALSLFGPETANLTELFQQASTCFDARVTGSAVVAGRATYVVDLGATKCPSASASEMNGRLIVWVDEETFFVLKQEQHNSENDQIVATSEVTQIQYNAPIDPAQFTFTPPAGATITDNRPKPAPSADQFKQQLEQLAQQVEFPVLVPSYLPPGLAPRQPKLDPLMDNSVEISYFPTGEPDKDSMASMMKGLTLRQARATNSLVARWTDRADPISIGGNPGWLRRGVRNADNTGSDSAALVLRDGALISVSSFTIAPEELVKVAAALEAVPGSHAPLPNPTPLTLAEMRRGAAFPVFVPTYVPAGLLPEPPTGGEAPGESVSIKYHAANGAVGLFVVNGSPDGSPGLSMLTSEEVKLPNGIAAHLIRQPTTTYGGMTLWWNQEGTLVNVSGPNLTQAELVKIAASMSKTADLGKVAEPVARPTPTALPPLKFNILRPTWLPETMTVREQREGDILTLGFDPHPNDAPHDVLTLREMSKALIVPGGSPDPQETHQQLGGYDITIVKRGQSCITLTWDAGDLNLTLTNPYDPPGKPRYTCDQLAAIVESIR